VGAAIAIAACSSRPGKWDAKIDTPAQAYGLESAVVVVDDPTHRLVTLLAHADEQLEVKPFAVGHHVLKVTTSPDRARLFALAAGDVPRRSDGDEYPSLTVIDGTTTQPSSARYTMAEPLSNLAIDPLGRYAAAFAGDGTSFVENPNEIVLFDLSRGPDATNPTSRTIRSFGGRPVRLTFTPTLLLPAGPRRLLIVETDQDVAILDLDNAWKPAPPPELTVRLTSGGDTRRISPAQVVVDDGDPARNDDARIGLRTANDTNVVTLQLAAAPAGSPNDFAPTVNLTDVGGIASDIAFVRTDGGLRLAALVPQLASAVLVEPDTSVTSQVKLPSAYQRLSLVTDIVGDGGGTDIALLWSGSTGAASGVAFWTLGKTVGQPYRSVEVLALDATIANVIDVPKPHGTLKLLQTDTNDAFYVLDLKSRTAAPLTTLGQPTLSTSPDGQRIWAFQRGTTNLASVELENLHPIPHLTGPVIDSVFDIARDDTGRSLVAIHSVGAIGATVFDAKNPDTATSRIHSSLLLEGL
jgi:hypothetical protein